jgi:hypothetical protein
MKIDSQAPLYFIQTLWTRKADFEVRVGRARREMAPRSKGRGTDDFEQQLQRHSACGRLQLFKLRESFYWLR